LHIREGEQRHDEHYHAFIDHARGASLIPVSSDFYYGSRGAASGPGAAYAGLKPT
jgi:hypothetical protein